MSAVRSPVLDGIRAARAAGFGLDVAPAPQTGPGWRPAHDHRQLPALLALTARSSGCGLRAVAAAWHLEAHAWQVASLAIAALLVDGSLPPLHFLQVRDDPASSLPAAAAVPPDGWRPDASPDEVARALAAHLGPLVTALSPLRARRALWREAGDRVGQAAIWCGEAFDARDQALLLGAAILDAPTELRAEPRFVSGDPPSRLRTGCCLSYRCPGRGTCEDCPLGGRPQKRPIMSAGSDRP